MTQPMTYEQAGVNVRRGDAASQILYNAAVRTWPNRLGRFGEIQAITAGFRAVRGFGLSAGVPDSDVVCGLNFDGIGTKVEIAERLRSYRGLGSDLLAMVCDDAACFGAEPVHVGSILDMGKVDLDIVSQLADGLVDSAQVASVAIINGELAELPGRLQGFSESPINWGAACFWAAKRSTLESLKAVTPGSSVIAISETSFRANGYSLLRALFRTWHSNDWDNTVVSDLPRFALRPATIYTPFITGLTGGLSATPIKGIEHFVHITGGGLLGRCKYLCNGFSVGMRLDNLPRPPQEMIDIVEQAEIAAKEAYSTWNMGVGLLVICHRTVADTVIKRAEENNLSAMIAGEIISEKKLTLNVYSETVIESAI